VAIPAESAFNPYPTNVAVRRLASSESRSKPGWRVGVGLHVATIGDVPDRPNVITL